MAMFSSTTFRHHCHSSLTTTRAELQLPKGSINQHSEKRQVKRLARLDDTDFEPYKAGTLSPQQLLVCAIPFRHRCQFWRYESVVCSFPPVAEPSDCSQVDYSTGFPVPLGYYTGGFSSAEGLRSRQQGEGNSIRKEEEESNLARRCAIPGFSCLRLKH